MKRLFLYSSISLLLMIFSSSIYAQDTLNAIKFGIYPNQQKIVSKDIDLKGGMLPLPEDVTLIFKGGIVKNGTLIGHNTRIKCEDAVFDNVTILGDWNIPTIYSYWFKNVEKENALKNVFALTNSKIKNKIIINEGIYNVGAYKEGQSCLNVGNNTDLQIDGTISISPNSFKSYNIIHVKGDNITISGKGTIVGDKHTHTGTTGEWGMGILVSQSNNVSISDLTIRDCWGDCIYIGGNSQNVIVEDCNLIHGRRQGVSVTSGDKIVLRNLSISDVGGTNPEYAIDIEPNENGIVGDVFIDNVSSNNCRGGILVWGGAKGASVNNVVIRKCRIKESEKMPISIATCDVCEINKCTIDMGHLTLGIYAKNVADVSIRNNRLFANDGWLNRLKGLVSDGILIEECKKSLVKNNTRGY